MDKRLVFWGLVVVGIGVGVYHATKKKEPATWISAPVVPRSEPAQFALYEPYLYDGQPLSRMQEGEAPYSNWPQNI